nr:Chain A, Amyloid Beta A4 Protein [Homo sapiens]2Y3K_B Chain B, Amyloid Beta A4 Protein [Homo sapiens]2Y3K_C Chain C, Amyloid Beta A4 Protein [Homo sapiens]2Y3K_D Chain D, Amyloid Beta A4 Protein [Homo sapiens]2Y3K_E Chain E, Amyloid Beta A4 Protein [Homo sapiens]2Y3K_F Chain F, Amyloid Beta A4 Protein [Homo sapiens]2Y3K_G Chain G, Amyloid Beta A4 Protein [Homo sapiens]2Y3K_H Chain H, Amyloid Beta A4 Protein [Homo sapiens]2Y3L_A Chain A, Amyloid Beta A4 Protein [Homo sapiens]2Y3L_B Chain
MVGGVVIA